MFENTVYTKRRKRLRQAVKSGVILILGNEESPVNYLDNSYPFRQDSSFLYFFGLNRPGLAGVIDVDENREFLFGNDPATSSLVWTGSQPSVRELAKRVGITRTGSFTQLVETVKGIIRNRKNLHFLPPYRAETAVKMECLAGIAPSSINDYASVPLIRAVVDQRAVKTQEEIRELETALAISHEMYAAVLQMAKPGVFERDIVGRIEGIARARGSRPSFQTICTIHGETLHNLFYGNKLKPKNLLLVDSGVESPAFYASDITRTYPVSGKYTPEQKEIYQIVLNTQETVIQSIKPGRKYRDIHLKAAKTIAVGLKDLGLMRGDIDEAVRQGAHALFFTHGIGHMLGLDVHDMENFGEDWVGYDEKVKRSDQFGLSSLRFARELKPDFVLTVEPGIYFIPRLIEIWQSEKRSREFINYNIIEKFKRIKGIRIEDDVLVTKTGCRVLGKPIPKEIHDIESIMGA